MLTYLGSALSGSSKPAGVSRERGQHSLMGNLLKTSENVLMRLVPAFEGQMITLFLKKIKSHIFKGRKNLDIVKKN